MAVAVAVDVDGPNSRRPAVVAGLVLLCALGQLPSPAGAVLDTGAAANLNSTAFGAGADLFPELTTDGAGNWVAVWHSVDTLLGTVGDDFDIHVAHSSDNGLTWSDPVALNSNAATDSGSDSSPHIATDGLGVWVVVWESADTLGGTLGSDDDILFARSTDNGATWSAAAALIAGAASDTGYDRDARVSADASGNWIVAWLSNDSLGSTPRRRRRHPGGALERRRSELDRPRSVEHQREHRYESRLRSGDRERRSRQLGGGVAVLRHPRRHDRE